MLEVSVFRVGSHQHRSVSLKVLNCLHQGQCAVVCLLATRLLEGTAGVHHRVVQLTALDVRHSFGDAQPLRGFGSRLTNIPEVPDLGSNTNDAYTESVKSIGECYHSRQNASRGVDRRRQGTLGHLKKNQAVFCRTSHISRRLQDCAFNKRRCYVQALQKARTELSWGDASLLALLSQTWLRVNGLLQGVKLFQDARILPPLLTDFFVVALICGQSVPQCDLERLPGHRLLVAATRSVVIHNCFWGGKKQLGNQSAYILQAPGNEMTTWNHEGGLATKSIIHCSRPAQQYVVAGPVSQAVWQWVASIWAAISQQQPPPLHADLLLLADDRRGPWQPSAELASLWQRLRLQVIRQLWAAYCTAWSRPDRQMTPAHIATRVLAAARDQMRRDWCLVGSDIRLRAGMLSHWLRGRQPSMTQEQYQQRWCHGDVLCSLPEDMEEPPHIHWTAAHPVPLPAQRLNHSLPRLSNMVQYDNPPLPCPSLWHSTFPHLPEQCHYFFLGWRRLTCLSIISSVSAILADR